MHGSGLLCLVSPLQREIRGHRNRVTRVTGTGLETEAALSDGHQVDRDQEASVELRRIDPEPFDDTAVVGADESVPIVGATREEEASLGDLAGLGLDPGERAIAFDGEVVAVLLTKWQKDRVAVLDERSHDHCRAEIALRSGVHSGIVTLTSLLASQASGEHTQWMETTLGQSWESLLGHPQVARVTIQKVVDRDDVALCVFLRGKGEVLPKPNAFRGPLEQVLAEAHELLDGLDG